MCVAQRSLVLLLGLIIGLARRPLSIDLLCRLEANQWAKCARTPCVGICCIVCVVSAVVVGGVWGIPVQDGAIYIYWLDIPFP